MTREKKGSLLQMAKIPGIAMIGKNNLVWEPRLTSYFANFSLDLPLFAIGLLMRLSVQLSNQENEK